MPTPGTTRSRRTAPWRWRSSSRATTPAGWNSCARRRHEEIFNFKIKFEIPNFILQFDIRTALHASSHLHLLGVLDAEQVQPERQRVGDDTAENQPAGTRRLVALEHGAV